jgi:folate-binding protein YgfZ
MDLFERIAGAPVARLDLAARGRLSVSGTDRVRFLDGMLTNHVEALRLHEACYAALLDRKGRILADLNVLRFADAVLLDTAEGTHEAVAAALQRHVVADDVEIEDLRERWGHCAFEGPGAAEAVSRLGGRAPAPGCLEAGTHDGDTVWWLGGGRVTRAGVQVLGPRHAVGALADRSRLPQISPEQREALRIEAGLPACGSEMTERTLPAEAGIEHAISFTKGCFIGQEIVSRLRSRGGVNRQLVKLRAESRVAPRDPIVAAGAEVGTVTSAVLSPASGPLALGYVRTGYAEPGTRVEIAGVPAVVVGLPVEEGSGAEAGSPSGA